MAARRAAESATPSQDKPDASSSVLSAPASKLPATQKEEDDARSPLTQTTQLPPFVQRASLADMRQTTTPDRSSIISAKLQQIKKVPSLNGHTNGVENKYAANISSSQLAHSITATNGKSPTPARKPLQNLTRKDSSKAIDDLLAEGRAAAEAAQAHRSSNKIDKAKAQPETSQVFGALSAPALGTSAANLAKEKQKTGETDNHQSAPTSSGTSEQGEIHEEPIISKSAEPKTATAPAKTSTKASNTKSTTQTSQKLPPKSYCCATCDQTFGGADDLARHLAYGHTERDRNDRTYVDGVAGRKDYIASDNRRPREDASRPDPHRPRVARRYSDDRYDPPPLLRKARDESPDRHQQVSKFRQPNIYEESRRVSSPVNKAVNNVLVKPDPEKKVKSEFQASAKALPTSLRGRFGALPQRVENWLQMTDFYLYDDAKLDEKYARWKRLRDLDAERDRINLIDVKEQEEIEQAKARARAEALTASLAPHDPEDLPDAIPGATASPKVTRETTAQIMPAPGMPVIPDDDIGLRIKDSALRSAETSPLNNKFPQLGSSQLTSSIPLKRRLSANNLHSSIQPPEKLACPDTNAGQFAPVQDEPSSDTGTQAMETDNNAHSARSRDISANGGLATRRFRSRSPISRRDSDFLNYDDVPEPDERPSFRSRDVSPQRRGSYQYQYQTWRPGNDNSDNNEGGYDRDRGFEDRDRGRREYQSYGSGRGRGSRAWYHSGYNPRGNYRGGKGGDRDGGRYRR
jgi:hypothetical protein